MTAVIAKKRFGQHFLVDQTVLERIVKSFSPQVNDTILEIGPGTGALTRVLLQHVNKICVIELDRDLASMLEETFSSENLQVIQADALKFELSELIQPDAENIKIRIVGNLPYNISTPLLFHLVQQKHHIKDMTFMLQKEVAARITAQPGTKNYGRLTVMVGVDFHSQSLFDVPPEAFDPPPKVQSAVIRLTPFDSPLKIVSRSNFSALVKLAFSQRRKTIRNSLKKLVSMNHFESLKIDPTMRAENLSIEDYIRLSNMQPLAEVGLTV